MHIRTWTPSGISSTHWCMLTPTQGRWNSSNNGCNKQSWAPFLAPFLIFLPVLSSATFTLFFPPNVSHRLTCLPLPHCFSAALCIYLLGIKVITTKPRNNTWDPAEALWRVKTGVRCTAQLHRLWVLHKTYLKGQTRTQRVYLVIQTSASAAERNFKLTCV